MIGGAGFSAGNKGASTKQQGHFTLLQLKDSNHLNHTCGAHQCPTWDLQGLAQELQTDQALQLIPRC